MSETQTAPPVVDASPTAEPIHLNVSTLDEVLAAFPAAASSQEVLDLKPNTAAEATSGPDEQISQTAYVEMTKPDGSTFIVPKSNVEHYEQKGFTAGAEQDIPDLVAYQAERSKSEAPVAEAPPPESQA